MLGFGKKLDLDQDGKRTQLMQAFSTITVPGWDQDLVALGMISDLSAVKGKLEVALTLPTLALTGRESIEQDVARAAQGVLPDVEVVVKTSANVRPATGTRLDKQGLPQIQNVILVASGKGGVGKSTVAVNLAAALAKLGCKVGLLDADVYGPSLPTMFGFVDGTRPGTVPGESADRPRIVPLERYGLKLMSIGFLVDTSTPMVWRGPMIASAAMQLFRDVAWGELDYLVVDLPPGTGDIHLTIAQQVLVSGAVIVSTPQDVALADVVRAKSMFDKVSIPSLGIVENMSYFVCGNCDARHEIFFHGGARKAAERLNLPFLGEVPIEKGVMRGGDEGTPVVLADAASASAQAFVSLAQTVATTLARSAYDVDEGGASAGPTISIRGAATDDAAGKKKGGLPIIG